ncbi:MAG: hypothetical protein ACE14P_14055 [Methanotrichaceae archaeon]
MNRRLIFSGLTAIVLISLLASGIAEPANPIDKMSWQKGAMHSDLAGYEEAPMFIVIPRDQGNATSFISLIETKKPIIGTAAARNTDSGPIGIVFHQWMGFALKGNESRSLRISIESVRPVEPTSITKLLASNKSLDEIRNEIRMQEGNITNRGVMRLDDDIYRLVDIKMTSAGNRTVLDAGVAKPPTAQYNGIMKVGRINVDLIRENTAKVSQGILDISDYKYNGSYKVLLDAQGAPHHEHEMG